VDPHELHKWGSTTGLHTASLHTTSLHTTSLHTASLHTASLHTASCGTPQPQLWNCGVSQLCVHCGVSQLCGCGTPQLWNPTHTAVEHTTVCVGIHTHMGRGGGGKGGLNRHGDGKPQARCGQQAVCVAHGDPHTHMGIHS
jgi:hypothetical protein